MKFFKLTDKNFIIYAANHYNNPSCQDNDEFFDDLKRIKYIKKLLTRYEETGELKERLILNHIIILCNLFGSEATVHMLFLKLRDQLHYIKPFLILLSIMPDQIFNVGDEKIINTDEIHLDQKIINSLRQI